MAGHKEAPVEISIAVPTESDETVTCLRLPGPELFVANYVRRPFGFEDLVRAAQTGSNESANATPDIDRYLAEWSLYATLEATRTLLTSLFGPNSTVKPVLETDEESGQLEAIFELYTTPSQSFEEQQKFLRRYLVEVPRPADVSPTLVWDPPARVSV